MPELPEVEVVRRGLEAHVLGHCITSVEVLHPRPLRRHQAGPDDFAAALTGRVIVAARRRGKYLWLALDDPDSGDAMLVHLGMSGQMLVQPPEAPLERHLRVRFSLSSRVECGVEDSVYRDPVTKPFELRFVDQRMFGGLALSPGGAVLPPEIAHIALDPLDDAFDDDLFVSKVRRSGSAIKRILLNQTIISGVGNIYADEGLWRACIHGERPGSALTRAQMHTLLAAVRAVMTSALAQGGTSFDALYVNVNGESGYFDRSLDAYGQEGRPCGRCAMPVRRVAFMNRSSFFCPKCQPVPRLSTRRPA